MQPHDLAAFVPVPYFTFFDGAETAFYTETRLFGPDGLAVTVVWLSVLTGLDEGPVMFRTLLEADLYVLLCIEAMGAYATDWQPKLRWRSLTEIS